MFSLDLKKKTRKHGGSGEEAGNSVLTKKIVQKRALSAESIVTLFVRGSIFKFVGFIVG